MATPGDFTCAELLEVTALAEMMWADNQVNKQYIAHVEAAKAVLTEQTVQLVPLTDNDKDNVVKLEWVEVCDLTVEDCDESCDFEGGEEAGAECEEYVITGCKEVRFYITDKKFRKSIFSKEQVVAKQMAMALKKLDEHIAKSTISAIDSFSGTNLYTGGIGTVAGTNTTIPAGLLNADSFAYMTHAAIINQMSNPWMLSGSNFRDANWIAMMNAARPESAGDVAKFETFRKYFDLFNLDALVGKKTFMIDKGAVALLTKNYYSETPTPMGMGSSKIRWSIASPNLPGVRYDVYYEVKCVDRDDAKHCYTIVARFDTFQNPTNSCTPGRTGVLSFECS